MLQKSGEVTQGKPAARRVGDERQLRKTQENSVYLSMRYGCRLGRANPIECSKDVEVARPRAMPKAGARGAASREDGRIRYYLLI